MSLDIIYTSRLYRSSKLKDKITSTIDNPINTELVKQLESYIDETSMESADPDSAVDSTFSNDTSKVDNDLSNQTNDEQEEIDDVDTDDTQSEVNDDATSDASNSATKEETTDDDLKDVPGIILEGKEISDDYVEAATALYSTPKRAEFDGDINVIKGTLNIRDETSGVTRVSLYEDELWVYYDDSTNLNTVMVNAIDVLERAGYTFLKFNRLARSNNAIVFDVAKASTEVTEGGE